MDFAQLGEGTAGFLQQSVRVAESLEIFQLQHGFQQALCPDPDGNGQPQRVYAGNVVEKGKVLDIFQNPMHPYTIGLLKSKPIIGKTNHNERLYSIPGQVPNPINMPENCHFNERCEFCQEGCKEKEPKLVHVGNGHYVACFVNAPEKEEV